MKFIISLIRVVIVVVISLTALLATGCEYYQAVTYDNQTTSPVKVSLYKVPLDYTIIPRRTWNDTGILLDAGISETYGTQIPENRKYGILYKYAAIAITDTNEIIISKIYTWDELHDANWTVVIATQ